MFKYESIDIIAALSSVVELNTKHYKNDFKYDTDMIYNAAVSPDGENNRLLWLSRRSGTECFKERDVYIIESEAHIAWQYYTGYPDAEIRAFAVEVTGVVNDRVMGTIYELDYRQHAADVKKAAFHVVSVRAEFEDGVVLRLPYEKWDGNRQRLFQQHGELRQLRRELQDERELQELLKDVRAKREKETRPAEIAKLTAAMKPSVRMLLRESSSAPKPPRKNTSQNKNRDGER